MSILTFSNIGQSFGAFDVFRGISAGVPNDGKIGLVGPNGIGKTTLLLILAGQSQPTTGSVHLARGRRLGYLPQEAMQAFAGDDHTVYEEMLTVFAGLRQDEERLHQMEDRMAAGDVRDELFQAYSRAQERFELAGGYDYELRIQQTLDGLGFGRDSRDLSLSHLSGGQKTRALLARLLLERPDLLVLDEPTNHLDVEALEWLEGTLRAWTGALLIVSHDRYFVDRVVDTIWEMSRAGVDVYHGNYSAYLRQRQERWEKQQQVYADEKARLEKEMDYIRRNIAGQRTDMAKGKLKRIGRELVAIEKFGLLAAQAMRWSETGISMDRMLSVDEAHRRIQALRPPASPPQLGLRLRPAQRSGNTVLRARKLRVGYPGKPLFGVGDLELRRGECAALIGPNGTGKTTFLKTILNQMPPLAGEISLGAGLKIGYFAQAHDGLDLDNTVLDELLRHKDLPVGEARNYLAQYLFRDDDVFKPVRALSGGERGRLALAILALVGANFLLLDEPTNHLDIPAQEVLQEALERLEGTILLVTHDRYLVDRLATQVWELQEKELRVYQATYREYLADRERAREAGRLARAAERNRSKRNLATRTRESGAEALAAD